MLALKFIVFNQTGWHPGVSETSVTLEGGGVPCAATVYRRGHGGGGVILAVHGMTPRGNADPRMSALCRSLAACGFTVVSPLLSEVAACAITASTVDVIEGLVLAIAGDRSLSPSGRVSLFSASFSAGMAVIAAARPRIANLVDALCIVGSYGEADSVIRYLLLDRDADPYGRLIILKNFIARAPGCSRRITEVLETAILDEGYKRHCPRFPEHRAGLTVHERRRLDRLLDEAGFRLREWNRMLASTAAVRGLMQKLSVKQHLGGLQAKLVIVHGRMDRVIPAGESRRLHDRCRALGVDSHLLVTPLLDHGDVSLNLRMVPDIARLARSFDAFFKPMRRRSHGYAGRRRCARAAERVSA